jgi:anti-sigma B factor antagonist
LVQRWHKVVLDLSGLNYIDGKGMSALLACLRLIQENRGIVRLCELSKNMTALFKMMRIHRAYKIHLSCADAVSSLQSLQY